MLFAVGSLERAQRQRQRQRQRVTWRVEVVVDAARMRELHVPLAHRQTLRQYRTSRTSVQDMAEVSPAYDAGQYQIWRRSIQT